MPPGLELTTPVPEPDLATPRLYQDVKLAVTAWSAVIVKLHVVPWPAQAPVQPANTELPVAIAFSVIEVPLVNVLVQSGGQLIPRAGAETMPVPPGFVAWTVTVRVTIRTNVAVTDLGALIVTVQELLCPLQSPPQPMKTELVSAVAVSVTVVPVLNPAEQAVPQLIPAGLDTTRPLPVPLAETVKGTGSLKLAVTVRAAVIVTVHCVACPLHAPPHPVNAELGSAVAVRVTDVPLG